MKVCIIGGGILGGVHAQWLKANTEHEVMVVDPDPKKGTHTLEQAREAEVFIVCVPTNSNEEGNLDTSIVESVVVDIFNTVSLTSSPKVIIRSTLPVGTMDRLQNKFLNLTLWYVPEFLTERFAVRDFWLTKEIVIGDYGTSIGPLINFPTYLFPAEKFTSVPYGVAEMLKLATNSFYATKIIWANELKELCDKMNVEYRYVKDFLALNPRIGSTPDDPCGQDVHLRYEGKRGGYGGKCLPKDSEQLANHFEEYLSGDYIDSLMDRVITKNLGRRQNPD